MTALNDINVCTLKLLLAIIQPDHAGKNNVKSYHFDLSNSEQRLQILPANSQPLEGALVVNTVLKKILDQVDLI